MNDLCGGYNFNSCGPHLPVQHYHNPLDGFARSPFDFGSSYLGMLSASSMIRAQNSLIHNEADRNQAVALTQDALQYGRTVLGSEAKRDSAVAGAYYSRELALRSLVPARLELGKDMLAAYSLPYPANMGAIAAAQAKYNAFSAPLIASSNASFNATVMAANLEHQATVQAASHLREDSDRTAMAVHDAVVNSLPPSYMPPFMPLGLLPHYNGFGHDHNHNHGRHGHDHGYIT